MKKAQDIIRWLMLLALFTLVLYLYETKQGQAAQVSDDIPEPSLSVYLEQQSIRENEPVPVTVWVSNTSAHELTALELHITASSYLHWYEEGCKGTSFTEPIVLDPIPAYSTAEPRSLCIKLAPDSRVGQFNVHFNLQYEWVESTGEQRRSFVTAEKSIQTDILGMNALIGVPLTFAGFVVPGLCFLLLLRLWKVPFSTDLPPEDKLILSILVSILCIGIAFVLRNMFGWSWLEYFNMSTNISIARLAALTIAGILLGLIVGVVHWGLRQWQRQQEERNVITPAESYVSLLQKMLRLNTNYEVGSEIRIRQRQDGSEFVGTHWAQTQDTIYLAGAFYINKSDLPDDVRHIIEERYIDDEGELSQEGDKLLEVLDLVASRRPDSIDVWHQVEKVVDAATDERIPQGYCYSWQNREVAVARPWFKNTQMLLRYI